MTVKSLKHAEKDSICLAYRAKTLTIKELASYFNTSSRTIGRVLEERGLATPVPRLKGEAYQVMQLLKEHNLDIAQLKDMIEHPSLTRERVQAYLNKSPVKVLASFFYTSGMAKILEFTEEQHAKQNLSQSPADADNSNDAPL